MGDFIKELNIIDFLGILFPGSAFLLLINYAQTKQIFGLEFTAADVIFILTGGYFIGSLIHELGDLLEKTIWKNPFFDPKVYAARAMKNYTSANKRDSLEEVVEANCNVSSDFDSVPSKRDFVVGLLCSIFLGLILFCSTFLPFMKEISRSIGWFFIDVFFIVNLSVSIWLAVWNSIVEEGNEIIYYFWIQKSNQMIQTKLVNKGNYSKRVVFDGFHVMMRNSLLVIVILNICQYFGNSYNIFILLMEQFIPSKIGLFVSMNAIVILMILRYVHYSYLKYKYSYEDFLELF